MTTSGFEQDRSISRRQALTLAGLSASTLLSACSSSDTDSEEPPADSAQDEGQQEEPTPSSDGTPDIVTPLYSITLPPEMKERARWTFQGMSDGENPESLGAVFAQDTNVFLDDDSTVAFFVEAIWNMHDDKKVFYPQGDFDNAVAGSVEFNGKNWYIVVSRAAKEFLDSVGERCPTADYEIEEIASWVTVDFNPEAVTDNLVFVSFLESSIGDEWSHGDGADVSKERLTSVLESGHWDVTYPELTETTVRARGDTSSFDFSSLSFHDGQIQRDIPLTVEYVPSSSDTVLPSPAQYEVFDWEPYSLSSTFENPDTDTARSGVKITLIVSLDEGLNWGKRTFLLYEALPYALTENGPFLVMTSEYHEGIYKLDDPIIRDAADRQDEYLAEARSLVGRALSEQGSILEFDFSRYPAGEPTSADQVTWALPASFENNKFDAAPGYYVKLRYPSSSYRSFYPRDSTEDFFCTAYVYDYGNGAVCLGGASGGGSGYELL